MALLGQGLAGLLSNWEGLPVLLRKHAALFANMRLSADSGENFSRDFVIPCSKQWGQYKIRALIYHRRVLTTMWFNEINISEKSTPPIPLYVFTICGHWISTVDIGSTPTKWDTRWTGPLPNHLTFIVPEFRSQLQSRLPRPARFNSLLFFQETILKRCALSVPHALISCWFRLIINHQFKGANTVVKEKLVASSWR